MSYKIKYILESGATAEIEHLTFEGVLAGFKTHIVPIIEDDRNAGNISYTRNNRKVSEDDFFFGFQKPAFITKYHKGNLSQDGDLHE